MEGFAFFIIGIAILAFAVLFLLAVVAILVEVSTSLELRRVARIKAAWQARMAGESKGGPKPQDLPDPYF